MLFRSNGIPGCDASSGPRLNNRFASLTKHDCYIFSWGRRSFQPNKKPRGADSLSTTNKHKHTHSQQLHWSGLVVYYKKQKHGNRGQSLRLRPALVLVGSDGSCWVEPHPSIHCPLSFGIILIWLFFTGLFFLLMMSPLSQPLGFWFSLSLFGSDLVWIVFSSLGSSSVALQVGGCVPGALCHAPPGVPHLAGHRSTPPAYLAPLPATPPLVLDRHLSSLIPSFYLLLLHLTSAKCGPPQPSSVLWCYHSLISLWSDLLSLMIFYLEFLRFYFSPLTFSTSTHVQQKAKLVNVAAVNINQVTNVSLSTST